MLFRHCLYCNSVTDTEHFLCNECEAELKKAEFDNFMQRCNKCGFPFVSEDYECKNCLSHPDSTVFPIYNYNNSFARRFLELYKFEKHREFAKFFADILKKYLKDDEIIVPIPSSESSINNRGWDQMLEITKFLKNKSCTMIRNNGDYDFQTKHMDKKNRQDISKNKFVISSGCELPSVDSKIVIIDDVFTTGSTVFAALGLLRNHFYKNIRIITLYAEI